MPVSYQQAASNILNPSPAGNSHQYLVGGRDSCEQSSVERLLVGFVSVPRCRLATVHSAGASPFPTLCTDSMAWLSSDKRDLKDVEERPEEG